ncbi:septation protein SepH [Diaminobutyricimonas sp. TR449]|uniref:septation protein SepH n=1 Tax=Diaminobutyricimonas sp. TR449 TaxID=2708076 RepID=UPI0014216EF9|nr:septation protein SepH [Diaminobutyricimonas sp. TR449]
MQELKVIGVDGGALLAASEEGHRYRIAIDDTVRSRLKQPSTPAVSGRKPAPREIQAHIRAGMSAEDVAGVTGAPIEYIRKFEGPVLAEREYIVESALNVPVHTASDAEPLGEGPTFGSVIRDRLHGLAATGERWASWKEDSGWIVKLSFSADGIDHDARWQYEPRKQALAPLGNEAITLSQQGEVRGALIPRLRAVPTDESTPDQTRFDSGAFTVTQSDAPDEAPIIEQVVFPSQHPSVRQQDAVPPRGPVTEKQPRSLSQTADLLEALRRRRGEREAAQFEEPEDQRPAGRGIRLVDVPLDEYGVSEDDHAPAHTRPSDTQPLPEQPSSVHKPRKGRAAMPSWDEIVFGARSDDDLA